MTETVTVSAAEIARLAGVGRAAVSNWRRRHSDFPAPSGGTDASPVFSLCAVENWLRTQGKLPQARQRDWLWPHFESLGDRARMGRAIASVGARLLGLDQPAGTAADPDDAALVARAVEIGRAEGPYETFQWLRRRWLDTHVRQVSATPARLAELMVGLAFAPGAQRPRTVLDPACGTGSLLAAAARCADEPFRLHGQDADSALAALATVRLAFEHPAAEVRIACGDTLHADAHEQVRAEAVLCNPPFNERAWGREELTWDDPRWHLGIPPGTESELAWVLHCLARLSPGGTAVVLMPPAAASRKAGRRIRSALVREGLLRAVIALPPGAAPPHGVAHHLWVLSPAGRRNASETVLMVDTLGAGPPAAGKGEVDWPSVQETALSAWRGHRLGGNTGEPAAHHRAVPAIDLLTDDVDLTPARHVPQTTAAHSRSIARLWETLGAALEQSSGLREPLRGITVHDGTYAAYCTVGELIRSGQVIHRSGSQPPLEAGRDGTPPPGAALLVTASDLASGSPPTRWIPQEEISPLWTSTQAGDLVVAAGKWNSAVLVADDVTLVLGPRLDLLRPDPAAVDIAFLAGCLRSPAGARQAATHASTASRIDVRRIPVPRLPLDEQRRLGAAFDRLAALQQATARAHATAAELARTLTDALAAGSAQPAPTAEAD